MARQTSIEVYRQIEEEGLLARLDLAVYKVVFAQGPMTGSQLVKNFDHNRTTVHTGMYQCCLTRLRNRGVVYEVGTGACPITGRTVIFWDVTASLPRKKDPRIKKSKIQLARERIKELETEVAELKSRLTRKPKEGTIEMTSYRKSQLSLLEDKP